MSYIGEIRPQAIETPGENLSRCDEWPSGGRIYAYVNNDPLNLTDPLGLDSQVTAGFGGTIAAMIGLGGSFSGGLNIPDNPWHISGYGIVLQAQANAVAGGGVYLGGGYQVSVNHTNGPVTTGISTSTGWYAEADVGAGPSIGVSAQGNGPLFQRGMQLPNNGTLAAGRPGYGAGVYVGYGNQAGISGVVTLGSIASAVGSWFSGSTGGGSAPTAGTGTPQLPAMSTSSLQTSLPK